VGACGDSSDEADACDGDGALSMECLTDAATDGARPGEPEDASDPPPSSRPDGGMQDAAEPARMDATPPGDPGEAGMEDPVPPAVELPMDGTHLAVCDDDRDCNMGLGCYAGGMPAGYCTAECENDEDCSGLSGGSFTCGQSDLCSAQCEGQDDTSCPTNMRCLAVGDDTFRCLYPPELTEEPPVPFEACQNDMDCGGELECLRNGMGGPGFCSRTCTPDEPSCSDLVPPSGSIEPTCVPQNPQLGRCALDCESNADGCPEGLSCQQQGFYRLCLPGSG
jgi:hypothetical protein